MLGRVVHFKTPPQSPPSEFTEHGLDRGTGVNVEIVHHEMNPSRRAIALGDLSQCPHEGRSLAILRREGEPAPRQRFDDAEDICSSASDVLVVGPSRLPRPHRLPTSRITPPAVRSPPTAPLRTQPTLTSSG